MMRGMGQRWLLLIGLAATACEPDTEQESAPDAVAMSQDSLVSASLPLGSYPLATGTWDISWQCGVGLLVWVESEPTYDRIMGLRFDAEGTLLDPAPLLLLEQAEPNPSEIGPFYTCQERWISELALERSSQGFTLVFQHRARFKVTNEPQDELTDTISTLPIGVDGEVQAGVMLAYTKDSFVGFDYTRTLLLLGTGYDGDDAYALIQWNERPAWGSTGMSLRVVREDGAASDVISGSFAVTINMSRGFGCGFGRCLLLATNQVYDYDQLFVGLAVSASSMQMDSPIANGKPIARESCDFLVGSTVVNGINVTAGPHALPGTALLTPNHDGAEPRRFYLENGEPSSHTFSSTGAPTAAQAEPGLQLGSSTRSRPVGDGKTVVVSRVGNAFSLQFVGPNALVDVDGVCDPLGDPGLLSGAAPDCLSVPQGGACVADAQCASGECVDGVCCESACGTGLGDCLACSVAAGGSANGLCTPVAANTVCRSSFLECDATEVCDGVSPECPVDSVEPDGAPCVNGDCTEASCNAGECVTLPTACDDGNPCTEDSCFPNGGCTYQLLEAACDVSNPCATGTCNEGNCLESPVAPGTPCPGGSCNGLVCEPDPGAGGSGGMGGEGGEGGAGGEGGGNGGTGVETGPGGDAGTEPTGSSDGCAVATPQVTRSSAWLVLAALGLALRRSQRRARPSAH